MTGDEVGGDPNGHCGDEGGDRSPGEECTVGWGGRKEGKGGTGVVHDRWPPDEAWEMPDGAGEGEGLPRGAVGWWLRIAAHASSMGVMFSGLTRGLLGAHQ